MSLSLRDMIELDVEKRKSASDQEKPVDHSPVVRTIVCRRVEFEDNFSLCRPACW